MGMTSCKQKTCLICPKECDLQLDKFIMYSIYSVNSSKIIKIQSFFRGYILRSHLYNEQMQQEIS